MSLTAIHHDFETRVQIMGGTFGMRYRAETTGLNRWSSNGCHPRFPDALSFKYPQVRDPWSTWPMANLEGARSDSWTPLSRLARECLRNHGLFDRRQGAKRLPGLPGTLWSLAVTQRPAAGIRTSTRDLQCGHAISWHWCIAHTLSGSPETARHLRWKPPTTRCRTGSR